MKRTWLLLTLLSGGLHAACPVQGVLPDNAPTDIVYRILQTSLRGCPQDVHQFKELLERAGLVSSPSFVANRGFHNPSLGSFSVFERIQGNSPSLGVKVGDGEAFFGHFTGRLDNGALVLDQASSLMIELIAWDSSKGLFNFYELIGQDTGTAWFYRGDSSDIWADVQNLHLNTRSVPFGGILRCSGCHVNGGPILKEMTAPHNDWWSPERPLPLGSQPVETRLQDLLQILSPTTEFAQSVQKGQDLLRASVPYLSLKSSDSLPRRLRPLFCPLEVQIDSDRLPSDHNAQQVEVPVDFLVDSELVGMGAVRPVVSRETYELALKQMGSAFPETGDLDADHAWLTPVRAQTDRKDVRALVAQKLIDDEFVADVLAVDMTHPGFSLERCALLRLIPASTQSNWKSQFVEQLKRSSLPAAAVLAKNLTDPQLTLAAHRLRAKTYLESCRTNLAAEKNLTPWILLLAQRRQEVRDSDVSKNPRGQILEPGFRVIFPKLKKSAPGKLEIDSKCGITSQQVPSN